MTLFERAMNDLAENLNHVINYNWEQEIEDFEQQLFEENADSNHVFVKLVKLENARRVLVGGPMPEEPPRRLGEYLWNELLNTSQYFECDNCHHIDSKLDPIPPTYWQYVEGGEIAPAGFCVRCGCAAFPV